MRYDLTATHRLMLRDSARTEAFRKAIEATVRPGDAVLDVGAGSGILSLFAARAGARAVYAVECTGVAAMAAQLAAINGFANIVHVLQADIRAVALPEPVDVIVSEWLGTIGVDENLLGSVLWARDCWLKPGGTMIPARVTAWMAPVRVPMRPDEAFFRERPYGFDLSPMAEPSIHELLWSRRRVRPDDMAAPPAPLWTTDVGTVPVTQACLPARAAATFVAPRAAPVNGLAAWFRAQLAPEVELTNAPDAPETHWGQLLLPLSREIDLQAGDKLDVRFACLPAGPGASHLAWSVRNSGGPWEHHDTRALPGQPAGAASPAAAERSSHSELTRFLARLAIDPDQLRRFIERPEQALSDAKVPEAARTALRSRDQARIQMALYSGTPLR